MTDGYAEHILRIALRCSANDHRETIGTGPDTKCARCANIKTALRRAGRDPITGKLRDDQSNR